MPGNAAMAGMELPLVVVLGRAAFKIQDLLRLTAGSMIELDRREGEMADLVVRGVVVAQGEIVSISGAYGIRIRTVISQAARLALQPSNVCFAPSRRPAVADKVLSPHAVIPKDPGSHEISTAQTRA